MSDETPVAPHRILLIPLGFIIWSAAFVVLYAINAVGCAFGWEETLQRGILIAITLGFLGLTALAGWMAYRYLQGKAQIEGEPGPSLGTISTYGCLAAFAATICTFGPVFVVSLCV